MSILRFLPRTPMPGTLSNVPILRSWVRGLQLPYMKKVKDLDDPKTTIIRSRIIQENIFLKNLYTDFYNEFKNSIKGLPKRRKLVELGSGGGFIKKIIPDVITSDMIKLPNVDLHLSAAYMPFKNESIDRFFVLNVIHHIHDTRLFFKEINRCLKKNGKLVAIEPANTIWSQFIYKHFHYERFDPQGDWVLKSQKALSDANGALPWIIFIRDRKKFEMLFPRLKILKIIPHTPLRYLVSGGVSYRQLLPSWMYQVVKGIEKLAAPLSVYTGMFYSIEVEKRG